MKTTRTEEKQENMATRTEAAAVHVGGLQVGVGARAAARLGVDGVRQPQDLVGCAEVAQPVGHTGEREGEDDEVAQGEGEHGAGGEEERHEIEGG